MSDKDVKQPPVPPKGEAPKAEPKTNDEYTGKPQPGKTYKDNNGNIRQDH